MSIHGLKRNFNSGELSPLLDARVDVDKYTGGGRVVRNFIPRTYGAAFKRPGTRYLGTTKGNDPARLVPFNYSVDTRFQLEFSDQAVRFWSNDIHVTTDPGEAPAWTSVSTGGPDFYPQANATGGVVWRGASKRIYGGKELHTPTVDNAPASSKWSTSPAKRWVTATTYTAGDIVASSAADGKLGNWIVLNNHSATTAPNVDTTNYAPLWHLGTVTGPGLYNYAWLTAEPYVVGEKITVTFTSGAGANLKTFIRSYRCTVSHTSAAGTKPGVGASWPTRWVEVTAPLVHNNTGISYYIGDLVKVGSVLYISTTAHTSSATNEPGDVGAPWVVASNTVPWVTKSTSRQIGDWIMIGGIFIFATVARKSASLPILSLGSATYFTLPALDVDEWEAKDSYAIGDFVLNDGLVYVCIQDHTKDAAKEPGTDGGQAYWQQLGNISVWENGTNYTAGQYVIESGVVYRCVTDHTSGFSPSLSVARPVFADAANLSPGDSAGDADCRLFWSDGGAPDLAVDNRMKFAAMTANVIVNTSTVYFVTEIGLNANNFYWFTISATQGGAPINLSTVNTELASGATAQRIDDPSDADLYDGPFAPDLALGYWVADPAYILELETTWEESILFGLQWTQINDIMVFVEQSHKPYTLKRIRDDVWTLQEIDWDFPPLRDENIEDDLTLTPSATTGINVTVTANKAIFTAGHLGSYWMIGNRRDNAFQKVTFAANVTSAGMRIIGRWDLFTYGFWTADLVLQRSDDGSTDWQSVRTWSSNGNGTNGQRNFTATGLELEECFLRLVVQNRTAGAATDFATLEATESRVEGFVKITEVTSFTEVVVEVKKDLISTAATTIWAEGAFSDERGWPRSVTLHEQRLVFAGTDSQPLTIWGSQINDFYNFRLGTNDAASISLSLASPESNAIQWLQSLNNGMVLATVGDEWLVESGDSAKPITPTSVRVKRQSRYGSSYIPGVLLGDAVIFLQRSAQKLREFTYQFEVDKFVAPDLTLLAEHIAASGIKQMTAQLQPDTILWAVTNDGRLIGMTYERQQEVVAWHQHDSGEGVFESVSCIYGGEANPDEVWMIVKREVNGQTMRFIERFDSYTAGYRFQPQEPPGFYVDNSALVYCDCSLSFAGGTPISNITGLAHLEGEVVTILADGIVTTGQVVTNGQVNITPAANRGVVGLPFTAKLQSMKIDLDLQDGTAQGRSFSLDRIVLRFYKSAGCEIIADPNDSTLPWRAIGEQSSVTTLSSADEEQSLASRNTRAVDFQLRSSLPVPTNILAIIYKFNINGD